MRALLSTVVLLGCVGCAGTPPSQQVAASDLMSLTGERWTGQLTYMNYGEPKGDVTIPVELSVSEAEDGFVFAFAYPDEPNANGESTVTISEDGRRVSNDPVVANQTLDGGAREIITESECEDDDTAAICTMTYTITPTEFSMRKQVRYLESGESVQRNSFEFSR